MNRLRSSTVIIVCLILVAISLIMIYSGAGKTYFIRQLVWFFISSAGLILAYQMPRRVMENFALYFWLFILLLLVAVLFVGTGAGTRRWFNIGFVNFQPSEFAKLAVILLLAQYWANRKIAFRFRDLFFPVSAVLIYTGLVFLEPDLGTALIFLPILAIMVYWKGLSLFHTLLLFSPILSFVFGFSLYLWIPFFIFLAIVTYKKSTIVGWVTTLVINILAGLSSPIIWANIKDYQKTRIIGFLSPWLDPKGMNWNLIQSQIAVGSGQIFGKGFLSGTQKKLAFLPNRQTDFVFSTIAEEFGFIGSLIVLALFFFLVYQFLNTARKTNNEFASLVAIGLFTVLAYQVFVNIGMVLGLLPITGIALPFLSYGGSSLLFYFIAVGIILNIRHKQT
ncbi:MAG: rod shape-determining protein RodA [Candidatus Latescibacteria bacterium]|nr:rod shape-determining protein RodA [Candidatus Latescibacterota bacterium]